MNTQSNAIPDTPARSAGFRARGHPGEPAHVLVGATRIVGEPLDLYRTACRRGPDSLRRPDQHDSSADTDACGFCTRPDAAA